nr:MAG TPA: hypothetical protein [Caudoviricetes sp.]
MNLEKPTKCPIINNLKLAIETAKVIESYLEDSKATIQDQISKISYGKNVLDESKLRNLEKGLNSDLTYHIANGMGRKELADILVTRIEEIKKYFKSKFIKLKTNSKILNNALSVLDQNYNNGLIETRWMSVNSSQLYRNAFLQRLERDFEPTLRGIQYRIDFNIDTKKLLVIMKVYLDKLLEKQSVGKLANINTELKNLLDLTTDLEHMQVIVRSDALEEKKIPEESRNFVIEVPIKNKEDTGAMLRDIALQIEGIDNIQVEVLPAIASLKEPLEKYYQKITADINIITDILNNGYTSIVEETLPRLQEAITTVTNKFIDTQTTNEEFHNRINNYLNVLIRLVDLENYMTSLAYEVTSDVAKDLSDYIAFYNLYSLIMMYSVLPAKEPKKATE